MKSFEYKKSGTWEEASASLREGRGTKILAGGTDLLGEMKADILMESPACLIDIKGIEGFAGIEEKNGRIRVGAGTTLNAIAQSELIREKAPLLSEAAAAVATPQIRNIGTLGGNLCQDVRCWFYRYPHEAGGRINCARKCGSTCYAAQGDNRYHSIFGGMKTGVTPCTAHCPAGTDIPAYMEQLRMGNVDGAAQIIMNVNPMPMLTSRVCAHFCQQECNRCANDEHVEIGNVERFVGDYILENKGKFYQKPSVETGKKVAVIGAGPSGLSAAYYLRKAGNDVTVIDRKEEAGGMLMYAIPAYRLPKDLVRKFTDCLTDMGIRFDLGREVGKDYTAEQIEKEYDSVYYATGAWKRPVLGLAGEELTVFGLDFLVEVNKWMEGKVGSEVLVTGGGNVAMDVAITAKRLGAKKVTLACLETEEEMPASREEIARAREEGILIMPSWGLSRVVEEDGIVQGMELKRCVSVRDEQGHFQPQYDEEDRCVVRAENILMAVGQQVDLSFLDEKYQLQLNARGLIDVAEETQATSRPGIFAGGDAATGPATVIRGIAAGHKAAGGINRYLHVSEGHACVGMQTQTGPFLTFSPEGVLKKEGAKLEELPVEERAITKEDTRSLPAEKALKEASRCLNCGCYSVNASDLAPALIALDGQIITTEREMKAEEFLSTELKASDMLRPGEIVTAVEFPIMEGAVMHYDKFRLRKAVDFAIVSVATVLAAEQGRITGARIVLGGVAPVPLRAHELEGYLLQKDVTEETAREAAEFAVKDAIPMKDNKYKVEVLKSMVKEAILRLK